MGGFGVFSFGGALVVYDFWSFLQNEERAFYFFSLFFMGMVEGVGIPWCVLSFSPLGQLSCSCERLVGSDEGLFLLEE